MKQNYVLRLFRGEIPLWITFWIFGVAISYAASFALPAPSATQLLSINTVSITSYAHIVFMIIATWRSAKNYTGPSVWKFLTYITIIAFTALSIISLLFLQTVDWLGKTSRTRIETLLENTNSTLPKALSDDIELVQISLTQHTLTYTLRLTNHETSKIAKHKFEERITPFSTHTACSNEITPMFLSTEILNIDSDQIFIITSYKDKNNALVTDITIDIAECAPHLEEQQ